MNPQPGTAPGALSTHATGNGGASDAAAALKGANLAFHKQQLAASKPRPTPPPTKPNAHATGSLVAAAASREQSLSRSPSQRPNNRVSRQPTGGSLHGEGGGLGHEVVSQRLSQYLATTSAQGSGTSSLLHPQSRGIDAKSQSFIAATLATSRSASPSPHTASPGYGMSPGPTVNPHRIFRRESLEDEAFAEGAAELTDATSLAPTRHLISMFDGGRDGDMDPVKKMDTSPAGRGPRPKLRPPTPERQMSPERMTSASPTRGNAPKPRPKAKLRPADPAAEVAAVPHETQLSSTGQSSLRSAAQYPGVELEQRRENTLMKPKPPTPRHEKRPSTPPQIVRRSFTEVLSPEPRRVTSKPRLRAPTPPKPRGSAVRTKTETPIRPQSLAMDSRDDIFVRGRDPTRPPDTASSDDTFVSASSVQSPSPRPSPPPRRQQHIRRPSSAQSIPLSSSPTRAGTPRTTPRRPQHPASSSNTNLPLNALTNAIMAGSLAASRLTPSNTGSTVMSPAPPLPKRQKSPHLRQTLRQPASKNDEDEDEGEERRKKKNRGKHKHHEGARRRWREEITQRQRKRYEAVWASNRGLLLTSTPASSNTTLVEGNGHGARLTPGATPRNGGSRSPSHAPSDLSECVANVIVREIWMRSRLPADELAEVWDLVDLGAKGMLTKQEFVVGMWLVDQRLRGRKIPPKVGQSVWDSAQGIRVAGPKGK